MKDKEIIINGVNVSECYFLAKEDDYCSYSGEYRAYKGQCGCSDEEMCKDHPNCFYKKALKQLARKEQECEKLKIQLMQKSEVDTFFNTPIEGWDNDSCKICEYKQNYQAKEQECEELKNIINEAKNSKLDLKSFLVGEAMQNEYEQQLAQFKQTLAEIKKIAEQISLPMGTGKSINRVILVNQILQKISEVED